MKLSNTEKLSLYGLAGSNLLGLVGKRTHPPAIIWVLTRRCFYECSHCDSWRDETPIDLAMLEVVAGKIAQARTKIVALSGGEPMMVKTLEPIVERLKSAGKKVSINTNGHLLEENADWVVRLGVDHVQVSVDGHTAELHDSIRRRHGSFDKILRGIDRVRRLRGSGIPKVSVCATVMKDNFEHLRELVERFDEVADAVELQPVHDSPGLLATAGAQPFSGEDRPAVRRELNRLVSDGGVFDDGFYRNFERFLFEPDSMQHLATDHCMPMIFNTLTVRDRGEAYICRYPLGHSLAEESVADVWSSAERWQLYRRLSEQGCGQPCWIRCNIHPSPAPGRALKKVAWSW